MTPLTLLIPVWTVLVPLVDEAPDPEDVKPGWLGFGVFLLLAAAVVLLVLSLRKQLGKVNFDEGKDDAGGAPGEQTGGAGAGDQADGGDGPRIS